jgi:O-antigen ligase
MTGSPHLAGHRLGDGRHTAWTTAPILAALLLLVATFLHSPLADDLPGNTFAILIALVIGATVLWMDVSPTRLRGVGAVEWAMALYLMWNAYSVIAPHEYSTVVPLDGLDYPPARFIMTGTVIPFLMYAVGRYAFDRPAAVRLSLWTVLALAAYSAWVSILEFTGPASWVWPRSIVDGSLPADQTWVGRAVGVVNQPVVNGLILILGFAIAITLMSRHGEPTWRRCLLLVVAVACGYGLYLTHTRAAWLSGVVMLVLGALLAKGYRSGFTAALGLIAAVVALNWSVFISSDRAAGGVGSQSEVWDRLNMIRTALWAFGQKPIEGWGINRFRAVNTFHHQQWAPEVPWRNGYGMPSHMNELGILAELGLIGLALWIGVLALIAHRLWDAYRTLPDGDICGKPLAVIGIIALATLLCTGSTVDLRFLDFPTAAVFLLVGIAVGWCDRHKREQAAIWDKAVTHAVSAAHPR